MPDGVRLAGTLYRPRGASGPLPSVYIRLPYDRNHYGEALGDAMFFARHGYVVLVQDVRGKFESEGEGFVPWRHATGDGVATLDWITHQPWSNGKVGTIGCSALGELQYALARANHPAHAAMIPSASGGAAGTVAGNADYFGSFEGGVMQLAGTTGWFARHGVQGGACARAGEPGHDLHCCRSCRCSRWCSAHVRARTATTTSCRSRSGTRAGMSWTMSPMATASRTPALVINTWGDQTIDGTLAISETVRRSSPTAASHQHVIIAPGNHCEHELIAGMGRFGDLEVRNADQPYRQWYLQWFDYWLRGKGDGLASLPPYLYFVLGEQRWLSAESWPPADAQVQSWYLGSGGKANRRDGDGTLSLQPESESAFDAYVYDPEHPAPSRGGPLCCSADPNAVSGPVDQADVETRDDVLVYTSAPLRETAAHRRTVARAAGGLVLCARHRLRRTPRARVARRARHQHPGRRTACALSRRYRQADADDAGPALHAARGHALDRLPGTARASHPPRHHQQQLSAPGAQPQHRRPQLRRDRAAEGEQPRPPRRGNALVPGAAGAGDTGARVTCGSEVAGCKVRG